MAQLAAPNQGYRQLLRHGHDNAREKPGALIDPEPLASIESGSRDCPDAGQKRGQQEKVRQLPAP